MVHAPGGTAGRDREAADAFGGVRAGAAGWGVALVWWQLMLTWGGSLG